MLGRVAIRCTWRRRVRLENAPYRPRRHCLGTGFSSTNICPSQCAFAQRLKPLPSSAGRRAAWTTGPSQGLQGTHRCALPSEVHESNSVRSSSVSPVTLPRGMVRAWSCCCILSAYPRISSGTSSSTPAGAVSKPACVGLAEWHGTQRRVTMVRTCANCAPGGSAAVRSCAGRAGISATAVAATRRDPNTTGSGDARLPRSCAL